MHASRCHCTQFMVNWETPTGIRESFYDCVQREQDFDVSFSNAWAVAETKKGAPFTNTADFLRTLDAIHDVAILHLPLLQIVEGGYQLMQGRADRNWYGLSLGPNSDEQGINDIIEKIWIHHSTLMLIAHDDEGGQNYILTNSQFYRVELSGAQSIPIYRNTNPEETVGKISSIMISIYQRGLCPNGRDRLNLHNYTPAEERQKEAEKIAAQYLELILLSNTDEQKVRAVAITMRDLMQQHLYYKGNLRSLYILANILFSQNNLPLFYPRTKGLFSGNSVDAMVREIFAGQERFRTMFGDPMPFSLTLKAYGDKMLDLARDLAERFPEANALHEAYEERDFAALLRLTASSKSTLPLLSFLIQEAAVLNIDIFSKDPESGNALDIAYRFDNSQAVKLLKAAGLSETTCR